MSTRPDPEEKNKAKAQEKPNDQDSSLRSTFIQLASTFSTNYKSNPAVAEEPIEKETGGISPVKLHVELSKLDTLSHKHSPSTNTENTLPAHIPQLVELRKL